MPIRAKDFDAPVDHDESIRPGTPIAIYQPRRRDVEVINRLAVAMQANDLALCPTDAELMAVLAHVLRDATEAERADLTNAQVGIILLASVGMVREIEAMLVDWRGRGGEDPSVDPPPATTEAAPSLPTPPPTTTPSA